ncbi:MAG: ADP-ribosylglycohydrolase family protein [Candidatus Baltobacteraceae bacterium]
MPGPLTLATRERSLGCLLAGAAGDALGAPVEFQSSAQIRARHGAGGIRDFERAYGLPNAITDDTQMTLFTAEGLLDALAIDASASDDVLVDGIRASYLRWLRTQSERFPGANGSFVGALGLLKCEELWSQRAPGPTCLGALRHGGRGTPADPINDRKGCGGVMRVAPIGLLSARLGGPQRVFRVAAEAAALTHGHPSGYLSAGAFAAIVGLVLEGRSLGEGVTEALILLADWPQHRETSQALERARALARNGPATAEKVASLGGGWVGEEALAIALYCGLTAEGLEDGVCLAVNHGGDSDSTGAIAGNILGALHGWSSIPERWRERVELADLIRTAAEKLAAAERASPSG